MHTWALFSCSSLVTLTAYNLSQLPKAQKPAPEPEPDASDKFVDDAKFSLDVMEGMFPEFERIAQPTLPDQPQLSKVDERPGYNPALYDPAQYPVKEIDLLGALPQADLAASPTSLELPQRARAVTYRAESVKPLPEAIPAPLPVPTPAARTLPAAIATAPPAAAQPRPEQLATTPTFAASPATRPNSIAQVPTSAAAAPTAPMPNRDASESSELFAALPAPTVPIAPTRQVEPVEPAIAEPVAVGQSMTDMVAFDPLAAMTTNPTVASDSGVSMELATTRHELLNRYCDRAPVDTNAETKLAICDARTDELAQNMPEAAPADTPMPIGMESLPAVIQE